ncbi:MAG: PA14 domain-containing protein [Sedimentisphaerales bacterium]
MFRKFYLLTSFVLVLGLVGSAVGQTADGMVLIEYWNNIGGTVLSDLYNNARYPDSPDEQDILTSFDRTYDRPAPNNDNYGARIRGYLYPPETGDYNFWIAGDDACEFLLSTDDDPANVIRIAWIDGWCDPYDWDNTGGSDNPNQASAAPVTLQAGQKYYIEGGLKEGGGGDGIAVAWQGPGIADRAVISGDYLSSVTLPAAVLKASNPNPADGAVDADVMMLEWGVGPTAASHKVYLSTDATVDESDFLAETQMALQFADLVTGTAYYWRVDEVEADGTIREGNVWSFTTLPLEAHFPSPEDGAKGIESGVKLSWTGGKGVIMHDVYFGTDEAAVAAGDPSTFKGKVMATTFDPGALELFTTYYWRIDEFAVTGTNAGPVWSFSTPEYVVIDSEETTLNYDNTAEPYLSEAVWDTPQDLTYGGVSELTLRFHGGPGPEGSVSLDAATGTYSITGSGADIWGSSDQFHYGYRMLSGDGEIIARVVSNGTGTNNWAKGGVMIRETLDADSKHTLMALTGSEGGGIAFQGRQATGGNSSSYHGDLTVAPPYWVKLTRVGNTITAYSSADGVDWTLFTDASPDNAGGAMSNPIDVEMAADVYIGLFVTSHQSGERRTYTFDNVSVAGNISAEDMDADIGIPFNTPEPIYVALEDNTGAVATVTHPYAEATMIDAWRQWTIPLSKFSGVDPSTAVKLYIGVGDGEPGGTGTVRIDDIRVVKPAGANIVWVTVTSDDDADGAQDDQAWIDWLEAEGHNVDARIDYWTELDASKVDELNAADLVIVSRSTHSSDFSNGDEPTLWNSVTSPLILMNAYIARSGKWQWMNTTSLADADDILLALDTTHPLFDGVSFEMDNMVIFLDNTVGSGLTTFIGSIDVGNGTLIAQRSSADQAWIAEWAAGVEFYAGSGQIAGGPRMFFAAGTMETADPPTPQGAWNLTADGEKILHNAIKMMLPVKLSDVTVPSDIVKGVPNDGDWPGAETPPLAIDDKANTKYLHFKGDFNPDPGTGGTGIQVTPLDGATIVTGLTFTTANDAAERDPVAFELSGSNDSIDGPYTLIASGDIVDFAQANAWPRFTKNETPISFENDAAYKHYQIIFTAIRDAPNANSMQIAEVELLGVPEPTPADVTAPGDLVQGIPTGLPCGGSPSANYTPCGELPPLVIDNTKRTKYLNFGGNFDADEGPSGFQVTPSAGPTIVTGMTFITANDSPERDPIAFELYGSNESIDGPYELIAVGDIVDFAQADAWPRFRINATPISFDNTVAYAHYQVLFTAIRDASRANSMQIAEVELIGLPAPAASLISAVVRSNGVSGDRDPVGPYDGAMAPLATEPGGLMDGNLVFSDRTYPWAGVPAEYVGTEYIRTFNSDKNGGTLDVTYEVTISRPAIVWITIDDRIPAEWDAGGAIASPQDAADYVTAAFAAPGTFSDTGIDLFVRENDTTDRSMSVYAAELDAGTYVFGSMDSGKNFYSIGAVE